MATGGYHSTQGKSPDQSGKKDKNQVNEMNIVLVGRTGSGKSALANNILKEYVFQSFHSPVSVTCSNDAGETATNDGYKVNVVDTPGLKHTTMKPEEVKSCIVQAVDSLSPHAIIYVGRVGRYSDEEHLAMQDFITILGADVFKYTIFVLTYRDLLQQENAEHYVDRLPKFFKTFIERCGGRKLMFNSLSYNDDNDKQHAELFSMIKMMRQKNNPPSFVRCEQTLTLIVRRVKDAASRIVTMITKRNILRVLMALLAIYALSYFF